MNDLLLDPYPSNLARAAVHCGGKCLLRQLRQPQAPCGLRLQQLHRVVAPELDWLVSRSPDDRSSRKTAPLGVDRITEHPREAPLREIDDEGVPAARHEKKLPTAGDRPKV